MLGPQSPGFHEQGHDRLPDSRTVHIAYGRPCDEHQVRAWPQSAQYLSTGLAQTAFRPVAHDRASDLLADREADPNVALVTPAHEQKEA